NRDIRYCCADLCFVRCRLRHFVPFLFFHRYGDDRDLHSFPTRRSSDLIERGRARTGSRHGETAAEERVAAGPADIKEGHGGGYRSEEHTSELQSHLNLVCRLLLEKKNKTIKNKANIL